MPELNEVQKAFLVRAINLQEYVLDFQVSDEEFVADYGATKETFKTEIENLRELL